MIAFAALLPGYVLSIFYRAFLSVIAQPVMADLGIGPRELGFLGAAWFVTFALAQFPVGLALDRIGPRRTVALAMAVGSAGALLFGVSDRFALSALGMAMIGVGCAPVFMAALFLFAREAPERFGALSALFIGIGSLGNLAGATPLALAAARYGWRPTMLAVGLVFLAATVLAALVLRDPPRAVSASGEEEGLLRGLRSIVSLRPLWLLAPLTFASYAILVTARGLWIAPFFTQVHGFDAVDAGNATFAMALTMTAGAFLYGALEKATGRQKPLLLAGTSLTAIGFAALGATGASSWWLAAGLFAAIGLFGFTYATLMSPARLFFPAHLAGRGLTGVNFLFISGAAVAQSASGWFVAAQTQAGIGAAATFANLHFVFAAVLALCVAIYAFTPERPAGTC